MGRFGDYIAVESHLVHVPLGDHILHQVQSRVVLKLGVEIRQLLGSEGASGLVHTVCLPLFIKHLRSKSPYIPLCKGD